MAREGGKRETSVVAVAAGVGGWACSAGAVSAVSCSGLVACVCGWAGAGGLWACGLVSAVLRWSWLLAVQAWECEPCGWLAPGVESFASESCECAMSVSGRHAGIISA